MTIEYIHQVNKSSKERYIKKSVKWFRFHKLSEEDREFVEQSWLKSSHSKELTLARYYYNNIDTKFKDLVKRYG